jgi:hypothetical protein
MISLRRIGLITVMLAVPALAQAGYVLKVEPIWVEAPGVYLKWETPDWFKTSITNAITEMETLAKKIETAFGEACTKVGKEFSPPEATKPAPAKPAPVKPAPVKAPVKPAYTIELEMPDGFIGEAAAVSASRQTEDDKVSCSCVLKVLVSPRDAKDKGDSRVFTYTQNLPKSVLPNTCSSVWSANKTVLTIAFDLSKDVKDSEVEDFRKSATLIEDDSPEALAQFVA